jgi:Cof subfamily protein (haloacid dehalogenase superfamily)
MRLFETRGARLRRLPRIRCLSCDLDGTLLSSGNTIPPNVLEAIAQAQAHPRAIRIILASGRTDSFMRRYAAEIDTSAPIISLNGALVKDREGSVLVSFPVSDAVAAAAEEVTLHPDSAGMSLSLFTADGIVSLDEQPLLPRYLRAETEEIRRVRDLRPYHPSTLLLCAGGSYNAIQKLSVTLASRFGDRLMRSMYQSGSGGENFYLEVKDRKINKSVGLRHVIDALGVGRKETAAIGDYSNDLEMCTFAGVSAAMRNGTKELKSAADYVTRRDNDEGGVAEFLRMILEGRILP